MTPLSEYPFPQNIAKYFYRKLFRKKKPSRIEYAQYSTICNSIGNFEVVSFDVFDTLIARSYLKPADLFIALADKLSGIDQRLSSFASDRIIAESKIRNKVYEYGQERDPTLDEIYERIGKDTLLPSSMLETVKQKEIEMEIGGVYRYTCGYNLYKFAKAMGKRVVYCSDMYLPKQVIVTMLSSCGYEVNDDDLFVSQAQGGTKKDGNLFAKMLVDCRVKKDQIIHIGDNKHSDYEVPKSLAIKSYYIPRVDSIITTENSPFRQLFGSNERESFVERCYIGMVLRRINECVGKSGWLHDSGMEHKPYLMGYTFLGSVVYSLAKWIFEESKIRRIKRIVFLSRDGYLVKKAYDDLGYGEIIPSDYLKISRKILFPVQYQSPAGLDEVLSIAYSSDLTVREFLLNRFGDDELKLFLEELLKKLHLGGDERLSDFFNEIAAEIRKYQQVIAALTKEKAQAVEAYYNLNLVEAENGKVGIFDVGRKGTFQKYLQLITGSKIYAFYVCSNKKTDGYVGPRNYSVFSEFENINTKVDSIPFEIILSENRPSFHRLNDSGHDYSYKSSRILSALQVGAMDAVRDFASMYHEYPRFSRAFVMNALGTRKGKKIFKYFFDSINFEDSVSKPDQNQVDGCFGWVPSTPRQSKKILFFSPAQARIPGGAERVTGYLADHFVKLGYDVLIATSGAWSATHEKSVYQVDKRVQIFSVNTRKVSSVELLFREVSPDVIVVLASGTILAGIVQSANNLKIPLILSERAEPLNSIKAYWNGDLQRYIEMYRRANLVLVQLKSFKKVFSDHGLAVQVAHNPIPEFKNAFYNEGKRIVCLARFSPQKRMYLLILAFIRFMKTHPDWVLECYGSEANGARAEIERLVETSGASNSISLNNPVDNVEEVLSNSTLFVLPSLYEGFPNALAEALSAGIPVIGFKECPGVNEMIVDGCNGILVDTEGALGDSCRVDRLVQALEKIADDSVARAVMSQKARELSGKYSAVKAFNEWEEAISSML